MRIDVTGKHMTVTPAIEDYAVQKSQRLPKYYDGVQQVRVILEELPKHEFAVELCVDVERHDTFVAKAHTTDLYAAIDEGVDKMVRQLTDFKERLKNTKR